MTAYDTPTVPRHTLQRIGALHLQTQANGEALVIDDRTLTAARVNRAAHVILHALEQPRTRKELAAILAAAANCDTDAAVAHVDQLVEQLGDLGWIEFQTALGCSH